jgi:ligand-binding sensor domain-containing protein
MRLSILSILITVFFFVESTTIAQVMSLNFNEKINPIAFVKTNKDLLFVSDKAIFSWDKNIWKLKKALPNKINAAIFNQNKLWLGGSNLSYFDEQDKEIVAWKSVTNASEILSLKTNALTQDLLVATNNDGALRFKNGVLDKTLIANIRAEDACTCGDYTWIGTNTGLARLDKGGQVQMYIEEGVGGFEIPDNIVLQLHCMGEQHLLVIMPDALAFLDASEKSASSHAESFDFLGKKGNEIFDAKMTSDGDILFLTQAGVIWMEKKVLSEHHEHGASIEVYSNAEKPKITKINSPLLSDKVWKKCFFDNKQNLWLASDSDICKIPKKEWQKFLNKL